MSEFDEVDVDEKQLVEAFSPQPSHQVPAVNTGSATTEYVGAQSVAVYRDVVRIQQQLKVLASMAGESWFYRYPVKNKGRQNFIEGPSIKLANDLARTYGNCNIDVRAMDEGDSWIFYARFHDLETGFSLTRAFQQRKNQETIKGKDVGRQLDIVFQIGQSKAIRNVVVNALQTFSDFAFQEAKNDLVGRIGKNLDSYREKVVARLDELNIDKLRVERVVGRSAADWLAQDVARIIAELQSINDGMATADETYPRDKQEQDGTAKESLDTFAGKAAPDQETGVKPEADGEPIKEDLSDVKAEDKTPFDDDDTFPGDRP